MQMRRVLCCAAIGFSVGGLAATLRGQAPPTGACCVSGGGVLQCFEVTADQCADYGGDFHGEGTSCAPFLCNSMPTGACCWAGGDTCFTSTEQDCIEGGGTFLGLDSSCEPYPCTPPPSGACCLEDVQHCFETDAVQCANFKGVFHQGASCKNIKCGDGGGEKELGACCLLGPFGMSCSVVTEASCLSSNGTFHGVGTMCNPSQCDPGTGPVGACCFVGGGNALCTQLHQSHCEAQDGEFQGEGTECEPNPCHPSGDCDHDGDTDVHDLLAVIAAWGPCPPPAKPCYPDLDASGNVNVADLLIVIQDWG